MRICVLLSCMFQKNHEIIEKSNISTDCVVVNQCDNNFVENFVYINKQDKRCNIRFIHTTERGLSKSRNLAIKNAPDDSICLICDDDEVLSETYEQDILSTYNKSPEASIITFALKKENGTDFKKISDGLSILNIRKILQTSSVQITFSKQFVVSNGIIFDEKMGSGTGNGSGEETKFLFDVRKSRGKMYSSSKYIGILLDGESKWFHGYTEQYMRNRGWVVRRSMGFSLGILYLTYWIFSHVTLFINDISLYNTLINAYRGFFEKRL